ncbi:hypothetical protein PYW07_013123 [Mythimna separata]|uniref:LRRNT domain-containing protein n=1 Tax=Mythimna separata TaxID=271217 RepID=A0AAD7Y5Y6_MYTSE|nr:hypothetical protein PYW07_013123 [Mythimna separata]
MTAYLRLLLACVVLVALASLARGAACPWACSCRASAADCAHRGLLHVPKRLPTDSHRLTLLACVVLVALASLARGAACPWACSCRAAAADCAHRGLLHVPKRLPTDSHRL